MSPQKQDQFTAAPVAPQLSRRRCLANWCPKPPHEGVKGVGKNEKLEEFAKNGFILAYVRHTLVKELANDGL